MHRKAGKKNVGRIAISLLILLAACVLVAGCDYFKESAYINNVNSIVDRYNNLAKQGEQVGNQFGGELEAASNNADNAAIVAGINQVIDKYMPQFQAFQSQLQQLQAEFNALQPPPRFANNHVQLRKSMDMTVQAFTEVLNALNLLRDPNTANAGVTAAENAMAKENEGINIGKEAIKGISVIRWPLLIGIIAGVLIAASALGYWSGRIARNNGSSFWGFFFVGFFLGLIGVLITWLVTRGEKTTPIPQPQYAYPAQAIPPGQVRPPGYTTPPTTPQAPPPARRKPRAKVVAPDKTIPCRYCGAQVPITKPKCPNCGRMMMGL